MLVASCGAWDAELAGRCPDDCCCREIKAHDYQPVVTVNIDVAVKVGTPEYSSGPG